MSKNITKRISIECGTTFGWERFVGQDGLMIGVDTFGASGKGNEVYEKYGFEKQQIVNRIMNYYY